MTLRALPRDLSETYARIIQKVYRDPGGDLKIETMRNVFRWVLCARRPLLIEELEEAVALKPSDKYLHTDRIATGAGHNLVGACGNLVTYNRSDRTVTFAHYTVHQFLCHAVRPDGPQKPIWFERVNAETEIGRICVAYLSFSDFETQLIKAPPPPAVMDNQVIEQAIWSQVPLSSFVRKAITPFTSWGTPTHRPVQRMTFALPVLTQQAHDLGRKYAMLEYLVEFWTFHTSHFTRDMECWTSFKLLTFYRQLSFEFRPWHTNRRQTDMAQHEADFNWMPMYSWAIDQGMRSFLELIWSDAVMIRELEDYYSEKISKVDDRTNLVKWVSVRESLTLILGYDKITGLDNFWSGGFIYHAANMAKDTSNPGTLHFMQSELILRSGLDATNRLNTLFEEAILLAVKYRDAPSLTRLLTVHVQTIDQFARILDLVVKQGHIKEFPITTLFRISSDDFQGALTCLTDNALDELAAYLDQCIPILIEPEGLSWTAKKWVKEIRPYYKWLLLVRTLSFSIDRHVPVILDLLHDRNIDRFMGKHKSSSLSHDSRLKWDAVAVAFKNTRAMRDTGAPGDKAQRESILMQLIERSDCDMMMLLDHGISCLSWAAECSMTILVRTIMPRHSQILGDRAYMMHAVAALLSAMRYSPDCLEIMLQWQWPSAALDLVVDNALVETLPASLGMKLRTMAAKPSVRRTVRSFIR
ncbi:hypothetical protein V2W45_1230593 [Cenococcum geophilum]